MPVTATEKIAARDDVVLTELADGTGVLLHLGSKFYFTLNRTGVFVWKAISTAPLSAVDLADKVSAAFEVGRERAESDVLEMINQMLDEELVQGPSSARG